jgi:hypothetical protein
MKPSTRSAQPTANPGHYARESAGGWNAVLEESLKDQKEAKEA